VRSYPQLLEHIEGRSELIEREELDLPGRKTVLFTRPSQPN
jgi:hypothetical protein